ncbi:MAG TPA: hypothetical protein VGX76_22175, partial [Pirellulales bacterium]|nr:hypothetical protein [Pirellulales bacterium]
TDAGTVAADLGAYVPVVGTDAAALRAESVRQERARIQDLTARAELLRVSQVELEQAVNEGWPIEQALKHWTDKAAQQKRPIERIDSGRAEDDKFFVGAVDALWHRSGSPFAAAKPAIPEARDLAYKSLLQICEMTLARGGQRVAVGDPDDIATAALRGSGQTLNPRASLDPRQADGATDSGFGRVADFPNILSALVGKMLDLPPEYFPTTYRHWAAQLPSVPDFKPKTILAAGEFGELPRVDDGDDFVSSNIGEEASWIATDMYGDEFALTPRMVVDDNLGVFEEAVRDKQMAHDLTLNRLNCDLLTGNATAGDGFALYDATHHSSNDIASGSGGAPSQTQLSTMRQNLRAMTGVSKKRKLNLTVKGLLIPIELETTTQQLLSTNVRVIPVSTSTGEIFRGELDFWVEPMLSDNSALIWYAFADRKIIRPIVYCFQTGFEAMKTRLYFNPKNNSRVFQCEGRFAAAVRNWRGTVRNAGQ